MLPQMYINYTYSNKITVKSEILGSKMVLTLFIYHVTF